MNSKNKPKQVVAVPPKKAQIQTFTYNENELKSLDFSKVFNEKQRTKYKEIFIFFDKSSSGFVKREDLPFMVRAVGHLVSTYEVRQLAEKLDTEKTGKLSLRQYHVAIHVFKDKKIVKQEIETSLSIFDKEKDGQVDVQELKNILMNMGDIVNNHEVRFYNINLKFESVFAELKMTKGKVKLSELVDLLMIQPTI